jgi:hypothetical protein
VWNRAAETILIATAIAVAMMLSLPVQEAVAAAGDAEGLTTSENRKFAVLMRIALTHADDPMSQFCNVPAEKASHVTFSPSSARC